MKCKLSEWNVCFSLINLTLKTTSTLFQNCSKLKNARAARDARIKQFFYGYHLCLFFISLPWRTLKGKKICKRVCHKLGLIKYNRPLLNKDYTTEETFLQSQIIMTNALSFNKFDVIIVNSTRNKEHQHWKDSHTTMVVGYQT